jgi:hypothetical protein
VVFKNKQGILQLLDDIQRFFFDMDVVFENPGKVEEVVHHPGKPVGFPNDDAKPLFDLARQLRLRKKRFPPALDGSQGGFQLMGTDDKNSVFQRLVSAMAAAISLMARRKAPDLVVIFFLKPDRIVPIPRCLLPSGDFRPARHDGAMKNTLVMVIRIMKRAQTKRIGNRDPKESVRSFSMDVEASRRPFPPLPQERGNT